MRGSILRGSPCHSTIGGTVGSEAAALDPRITSVVSISGFTPMRTDTADRGTGGLACYSEERVLLPRLGFSSQREPASA
jgi:hypothetical protein